MALTNSSNFDLYLAEAFLDAETCQALIAGLRQSSRTPALTYGKHQAGAVDERTRRVTQLTPSAGVTENIVKRLAEIKSAIEEHFGVPLGECEPLQFLCYRQGDFFVAHQDGNTGMVRLDSEARRVSVTIFLNTQTEHPDREGYVGGSLVFSDWRNSSEHHIGGTAGTLVAFRSELTHEVKPVLQGERFAIVTWFRSPLDR